MGGCGRARRRRVLSPALGRRGRNPALVLHDRRGADRRHGRSPRHHLPHARRRRPDRADGRAGSAGASELSDVVCRYAGPGGTGADRHAAPVRDRRSQCHCTGCIMGRPRAYHAAIGVAGGGAGDDALRRLPLSPRHTLWRARQSRGDAGGVCYRDAGGPSRPRRDAIRFRSPVLGRHGFRHRLDDHGDAMGRGVAGRGRAGTGLRRR